jgi:hypothetical protein
MLLGIIIGLVAWQIVVFVLHCLDMEDSWLTTPIPFFVYKLVEMIYTFFLNLLDIQAYIYLITLGKNPFRMKICDLLSLNEEQREKLITKTKGKRAKRNIKNLFKNNPVRG